MSVTATTTTELPAAAPSAAEEASREPDDVEYPEGHWIAQSVWHGDAVRLATAALHNHFRDREDVLVAMELVVYYERGDKTACLQPDVQVVFGAARGGNRSWFKVWEEGKAADFVLEVASPSTAGRDARHKAREYAGIGVREYWRLDPEASLMGTALEGYVNSGGRYDPVEPVEREGSSRHLRSQVLGLDLRAERQDGATVLVFSDPRTGEEFDGALEEAERRRVAERERRRVAERERRLAENRASAAETRASTAEDRANAAEAEAERQRRIAEERVRALEERLRNLTGRTPPPGRDP